MEQRPSPGDFVRESISSRASAKNPVPSQATVAISYPVGRPPLLRQPFLMLRSLEQMLLQPSSFFIMTNDLGLFIKRIASMTETTETLIAYCCEKLPIDHTKRKRKRGQVK